MKKPDIGFWEILLICLTAIIIAAMVTDNDVSVGKGGGCIRVERPK